MKKLVVMALIFGLTATQVEANPTAVAMAIHAYSGYENPTQYIFSNYDIWPEENEEQVENPVVEIQPAISLSEDEKAYLKKVVLAECGYDQPDQGVRMVVDVILNRIGTEFGNDIYGVVSMPYQFSTYWDGSIAQPRTITEQVDRIVEEELMYGVSYPALMYFTAGGYNPYCEPWAKVGDHYFGI